MLLKLLPLCLFTFLIFIPTVDTPRIRHYKWEVKYEYKSPDCYKKLVITINGKSPGPTILAQEGDTVIVEVTNKLLLENLAIHWHGIRQIGTPWSDGTEGVTQCPVVPGDTFKYEFRVDRAGTYLYHAHYGMQRESGLYGSIRVSVPDNFTEPFAYDYDRSIILTDWYHKSTYEQATGLSSIPFVWVGEPQSLLIQGKGKFNCSSASLTADTCNTSNPECSPYAIIVIPGKTYRLRVASLTALSALSFQIEGHNMTVVEADGHYVEPFVVKNLFIYSGETYSVLIKADQDPSRNYWMTTNVVSRPPNTTQGLGFLNYYPNHPRRSPPTVPPTGPFWNDTAPRLAQSLAIKAHHDFTFLIFIPTVDTPRVRHYKWEVKYEYKSPDCYKKLVITINGESPGPTILAQESDTVIVEVTNKLLLENLAIHWHGIRQIGTPWSDGTEGVTQCPVVPGDTFKYEFKVDRAGTYLYHAHYGMQRESGLYGSIRVSVPDNFTEPFAYDYDRSIILTDWYHKSTYEQATGLSSNPFVWVGEPQSLLIQGKGRFNCSSASLTADTCNTSNPECSPYAITVIPGKTYRLRVASLTALSALSFQLEGHNMTVVEADGHYVEPFVVKNLFIYSGETYSVIIKADQDPSRNYWMTTDVVGRPPNTTQGLGFLNYYPNHPRRSPPTVPPTGPIWNDAAPRLAQSRAIKAHHDFIVTPPTTSDTAMVFLNTQNRINGYVHWSVNNVSFTLTHTPYLIALKNKLHHVFNQTPPPEGYDSVNYDIYNVSKNPNATKSNAIYRLGFNTTVDIILQNTNTMNVNNSETHLWHLHGHDFWVLGYGEGKFDMNKDPKNYNLVNPIMKNTVPLHPYGWTALRFKADNPGAWLFHCHIEAHFYMGMGVVFEEGIDKVGE